MGTISRYLKICTTTKLYICWFVVVLRVSIWVSHTEKMLYIFVVAFFLVIQKWQKFGHFYHSRSIPFSTDPADRRLFDTPKTALIHLVEF